MYADAFFSAVSYMTITMGLNRVYLPAAYVYSYVHLFSNYMLTYYTINLRMAAA